MKAGFGPPAVLSRHTSLAFPLLEMTIRESNVTPAGPMLHAIPSIAVARASRKPAETPKAGCAAALSVGGAVSTDVGAKLSGPQAMRHSASERCPASTLRIESLQNRMLPGCWPRLVRWGHPSGGSAIVEAFRGVRREYRVASRRAARTRGFAAPAFAGCAFVERGRHARDREGYRGEQPLPWCRGVKFAQYSPQPARRLRPRSG